MRSFLPLLGVSLIGCASSPAAPAPMPLAAPLVISARGSSSASRVSFVASGGVSQTPTELVLPLRDLKLVLWTGEHPRLEQLEMPLGDVDVPASALPPNGLKLRNLRLSLASAARPTVVHAQDDALELEVTAPIRLDWSMVLDDGRDYPLGPARTKPVVVAIDVVRDGDTTLATVNAHCLGSCWSIDGVAELRDGALYGEAPAQLTLP